jgi:hypothetical protein
MSEQERKPLDLDAIEARANAATPGPWTQEGNLVGEQGNEGQDLFHVLSTVRNGRVAWDEVAPNAAFIAHAREDIPALVARVRELELTVRDLLAATVPHPKEHPATHAAQRRAYAVLGEDPRAHMLWSASFGKDDGS